MLNDFTNCRLLHNDILLEMKPKQDVQRGLIHVKESIEESCMQYFTVLEVSPTVTLVKKGDVILMSWKRITNPFQGIYQGREVKLGITAEIEVDCIVEE